MITATDSPFSLRSECGNHEELESAESTFVSLSVPTPTVKKAPPPMSPFGLGLTDFLSLSVGVVFVPVV